MCTEEENFTWAEWEERTARRHAAFEAEEAARENRMNTFVNYDIASFESFSNYGVMFFRDFYPVWW